ncbi:hypothetical protein ONZ45_g13154 [Pleurotus djamor]|nr:hypothetical protein ONZ45_g13154 [Pleurotus djamor]
MAIGLAPSVDPFHNMTLIIENVPDAIAPVPAYMVYATDDEGVLQLSWKYEVKMRDNWYEAAVTVNHPYRILFIVDWTSDSTSGSESEVYGDELGQYNVYALGKADPSAGARTFETERRDFASQLGWHSLPYTHDPSVNASATKRGKIHNTTTTWGNNVFVQSNWDGDATNYTFITKPHPSGGPEKIFDFPYSPKSSPQTNPTLEARKYVNASMSQIFYVANMIHDLYYRLIFIHQTLVIGYIQYCNYSE